MSKVMVFSLRTDYRWQQNMEKKDTLWSDCPRGTESQGKTP